MSKSADENGPHWADKLSLLLALIALCASGELRLLLVNMEEAAEAKICSLVLCRQVSRKTKKLGIKGNKQSKRLPNTEEPFIHVDRGEEDSALEQVTLNDSKLTSESPEAVMCFESLDSTAEKNSAELTKDPEEQKTDDPLPPPDFPPPEVFKEPQDILL